MATKNLTIRLSDSLIEASREYAKKQGKSLNEMIREFLQRNVQAPDNYNSIEDRILKFAEDHANYKTGPYTFIREEANER